MYHIRGSKHYNWKGGISKDINYRRMYQRNYMKYRLKTKKRKSSNGYYLIYLPNHPDSSPKGYVMEHRLVMQNFFGRILSKEEQVHHKDLNRTNNNIENLEIMKRSEHISFHHRLIGEKHKNNKAQQVVLEHS